MITCRKATYLSKENTRIIFTFEIFVVLFIYLLTYNNFSNSWSVDQMITWKRQCKLITKHNEELLLKYLLHFCLYWFYWQKKKHPFLPPSPNNLCFIRISSPGVSNIIVYPGQKPVGPLSLITQFVCEFCTPLLIKFTHVVRNSWNARELRTMFVNVINDDVQNSLIIGKVV